MSLVDPSSTHDPYAQPGKADGDMRLPVAKPAGAGVTLNEDGTATFDMGYPEGGPPGMGGHFENLAETLDRRRLDEIARDLLDAIDIDKEARKKRDDQYEEGMRRTGLGDDAPGGATFPGASKVVH